ncbi:MAG: nuclear transport factor 2 family protein [Propionibacteriaceae bacterium]
MNTEQMETPAVPWIPDLPPTTELNAAAGWDSSQTVPFYQGLVHLSPEALLASWSGEPSIDDPRMGPVRGAADFLQYVRTTREWLTLGDVTVRPIGELDTAVNSVEEVMVELEVGGERHQLSVAIVAERDAEHLLTSIRIYHSLWPLFPNCPVQRRSASIGGTAQPPPAIRENLRARAAEDTEAILATYTEDAVVHTSTAGPRTFTGVEEVRRLFAGPSVPGMKPSLEVSCVINSGDVCAVEYQVTHFSLPEPDQIGLKVFELAPTGKIVLERDYVVARSPLSLSSGPSSTDVGAEGTRGHARRPLVPRENDMLKVTRD